MQMILIGIEEINWDDFGSDDDFSTEQDAKVQHRESPIDLSEATEGFFDLHETESAEVFSDTP